MYKYAFCYTTPVKSYAHLDFYDGLFVAKIALLLLVAVAVLGLVERCSRKRKDAPVRMGQ